MEERTNPVSYALTVCRVIGELSSAAVRDGRLPDVMATSMIREATDAAQCLDLFTASRLHALPCAANKAIESALVQLSTLVDLADLVRCFNPAPSNAAHVALAIRDIAEQAARHLKEAEDALP